LEQSHGRGHKASSRLHIKIILTKMTPLLLKLFLIIVAQLDLFKDVTFDFKGVTIVGQGFIDQLFRVFQKQHADIKLHYINANDDVTYMIQRSTHT
jgi:hypothetical protein